VREPMDPLDALLAEQTAYYRARALEYDATVPADDAARAELRAALEAFAPRGRVLELACGTGEWTVELARHASALTAVDAAPEMLAIARARVDRPDVRFVEADLFDWAPPERYDAVFFSAWLSHVPPQRFEAFWALVAACLAEHGRVFFIDELPAVLAHEQTIPSAPAPAVVRTLSGGASYRSVKAPLEPDELRRRLAGCGWRFELRTVGWRFLCGFGRPA
jgi:SAM-dependent methyltransferase